MKATLIVAGIVLLTLSLGGTIAQAATFIDLTCGCEVESTGESCRCDNAVQHRHHPLCGQPGP